MDFGEIDDNTVITELIDKDFYSKKVFLNAIHKNGRDGISLILIIFPKIFIKSSVFASKIMKSIKSLPWGAIDLG